MTNVEYNSNRKTNILKLYKKYMSNQILIIYFDLHRDALIKETH